MTTPIIVQSTFIQGSAVSLVASFVTATTPGNWIVVICSGQYSSSYPLTPPAGFNILTNDLGIDVGGRSSITYWKVVTVPESSWVFNSSQYYWYNISLFEISGVQDIHPAYGLLAGNGTPNLTTGSLSVTEDTEALRLVMFSWDLSNNTTLTNTTPIGWSLLSPTISSWQGNSNNPNCAIWQVPNIITGSQIVTLSSAGRNPLWVDLQILPNNYAHITATQFLSETWVVNTESPVSVTQVGLESWVQHPSPVVSASQMATESWVFHPNPVVEVTQLCTEVWIDISRSWAPTLQNQSILMVIT